MIESTKPIPSTHTLLMDGSSDCHDLHKYLEQNELSVPVVIDWVNPGNVADSRFPILIVRDQGSYQEIIGLKSIKFCLPSMGKKTSNPAAISRVEKIKYVEATDPESVKIPA